MYRSQCSHQIASGTEARGTMISRSGRSVRGWMLAVLLSCVAGPVGAQFPNAEYLIEMGQPTFTVAEPVPMGFVNVANGNLHIEIPFASIPQRGGQPLVAKMVY